MSPRINLLLCVVVAVAGSHMVRQFALAQHVQCQVGCSNDVEAWGTMGAVVACSMYAPANCRALQRNTNISSGVCRSVADDPNYNRYSECPDCERMCANEVVGTNNRKHPPTMDPQEDCGDSEAVYESECKLITP